MNQQKSAYPHEEELIRNQKFEFEKQVNEQIFKLFGLGEDEINIVHED